MSRYTLNKNYPKITNDVNEAGIILRPFQSVIVNQKVYARKLGNAGVCLMTVLPFRELWNDPDAVPPKRCDDEQAEDNDVTFDEYGNLFLREKSRTPPLYKNAQKNYALRVDLFKYSLKFFKPFGKM